MSRWLGRLAPLGVALVLCWSYADAFMRPTFFGDQGLRLDQAAQLVAGAGRRVWLPALQLHIHVLYHARAPVVAYLLVPYAYMVLSLFLLAALCRAVLRSDREALLAGIILPVAFAGSSFHWLGRSLYQEVLPQLPHFLTRLPWCALRLHPALRPVECYSRESAGSSAHLRPHPQHLVHRSGGKSGTEAIVEVSLICTAGPIGGGSHSSRR